MPCHSRSDTAFHYESLQALDRETEYGDREARAGKYGFVSTAVAALAGGILGSIDLSLPYWLSVMTAAVSIYVVASFTEPHEKDETTPGSGFTIQLRHCIAYLKQPLVKWLFIYTIFMYVIVHIPYELYQPYLALLEQQNQLAGMSAPLIAGILFARISVQHAVAAFNRPYAVTDYCSNHRTRHHYDDGNFAAPTDCSNTNFTQRPNGSYSGTDQCSIVPDDRCTQHRLERLVPVVACIRNSGCCWFDLSLFSFAQAYK